MSKTFWKLEFLAKDVARQPGKRTGKSASVRCVPARFLCNRLSHFSKAIAVAGIAAGICAPGTTFADSAVAMDKVSNLFLAWAPSMQQAQASALADCKKHGRSPCQLSYSSKPHAGGFGAAVANVEHTYYVSGAATANLASNFAFANCRTGSTPNERCELRLDWFDVNYVVVREPGYNYSPAPAQENTPTLHYVSPTGQDATSAIDMDGTLNTPEWR
jgi:hypothetical protein